MIVSFNNDGVSKEEILQMLHAVDGKLRGQSRDSEADILEDMIDMVSGYYVGRNLDLK
ncbi:hypothetical protein C4K38_4413 [Pseudomonas chlororaphis subsp. piscium]|nr:hypothetical protein C4K38_4413 [Pseudomonas chlororaphis subsp. piscium]SDS66460.1 hypothetical protein SAMN05216585_2980 [Pseudomonas chlororaphis]